MITMSNINEGDQLGAQMGQFAMLSFIAEENKQELVFTNKQLKEGRGLKFLEPFQINCKVIADKDFTDKNTFINKYIFAEKFFYTIRPQKGNDLDARLLNLSPKRNYNILGPFGLYKQYSSLNLYSIFSFKEEIAFKAKSNIARIKQQTANSKQQTANSKQLVSIHYRRTDYLALASLNLDDAYYLKALELFPSCHYKLCVFSDDIDYCKRIKYLERYESFFSEDNEAAVDMCMMTLCDHNIIANSSFSMWGAILNQNLDKKVICPKQYIGERDQEYSYINGNYYPQDWIALDLHELKA